MTCIVSYDSYATVYEFADVREFKLKGAVGKVQTF